MSRSRRIIEDDGRGKDLRALSSKIRKRQQDLRELEEERNEMIRSALDAGWTHAQVSDYTGLTRARVGQIGLSAKGS